jgi:hypothetical protein
MKNIGLKFLMARMNWYNNQLVIAPSVLGRLNFARSSLRFTAPQQKR